MRAFTTLDALVVPLDRTNVDTDAILPKQFLKSIKRTGFGPYLFDELRYLDHGEVGMDCENRPLNPDFALNQARYRGAEILLVRENFGCGSSREHAVWALDDFGIRALIAPSFADIFRDNCLKNGLLPIVIAGGTIETLFSAVQAAPGYRLRIDLPAQTVTGPEGNRFEFQIDAFRKDCLLRNLDDIALTMQRAAEIQAYEVRRLQDEQWIFE
jgi:3-isopropylmalate dehydratase small subunit